MIKFHIDIRNVINYSYCINFQQLESLVWHRNGEEFVSAHNDGSFIVWTANNPSEPKQPATTPYGNLFLYTL